MCCQDICNFIMWKLWSVSESNKTRHIFPYYIELSCSAADVQPAWRLRSSSSPQRPKLIVVAANTVGGIEVWKQGDGPEPCIANTKHAGAVYGLSVAATGHCVSASLDWTIRKFDLTTGQVAPPPPPPPPLKSAVSTAMHVLHFHVSYSS